MDVFKLAFETTIVGLLTIGWLGVATHLLFPDFRLDSLVQRLPSFLEKNLTALGVGTLGIGLLPGLGGPAHLHPVGK